MTIRTVRPRRIAAIAALGAIVFAFALAADRPSPPDEFVNRPAGSVPCGHRSATCEHRM